MDKETTHTNQGSHLLNFFLSLSIFLMTGYLLIAGKDLLIPFVVAIAIWFLIISIADLLRLIPFTSIRLPYWLSMLLSLAIWAVLSYVVVSIITANVSHFIASAEVYQTKLTLMINHASQQLGIKDSPNIQEAFKEFSLVNLATSVAQGVTSLVSNAGVILIYVLFLIFEHHSFDDKLAAIITNPTKLKNAREIIKKISSQTQAYIKIKVWISLATALISYVILLLVGLDFAEFWALMIFLLNFIPTLGSIIATIFPCLLALLQFESWYPFLILSTVLTSIHFVIGNIIEPKILGKSINLSGLVIILSLAVWGKIWGIVGLFLSVPIMVILNIVLANFRQTRFIPILLSEDGDIKSL